VSDVLDGVLCQGCCIYVAEDADGFPRLCPVCNSATFVREIAQEEATEQ
jgi:hypothetical protein